MASFKEKEQLMRMKKNANINQSLDLIACTSDQRLRDYDKSIVKRISS